MINKNKEWKITFRKTLLILYGVYGVVFSACYNYNQTDSSSTDPLQPNFNGTLEILSPNDEGHTNKKSLVIQGLCSLGQEVTLLGDIQRNQSPITTPCVEKRSGIFMTFGVFSQEVILTDVDGPKSIAAVQKDDVGKVFDSSSVSLNLDTVAPLIGFNALSDGTHINEKNITVSGTCEDGLKVSFSGDIDGPPIISCVRGAFQTSLNLKSGDGPKAVIATQRDTAGNEGQISISLNLDTVAPLIGFNALSDGTHINEKNITVNGTCEDGLKVSFSGDIDRPPIISCVRGAFQASLNLKSGDGPKTVMATQRDTARNEGQISMDLILDTLNPSLLSVDKTNLAHSIFWQGDVIDLVAKFSEPVRIIGTPRLALNVGVQSADAVYRPVESATYNTVHTFRYTVSAGHNGEIQVIGFDVSLLNTIKDRAGNQISSNMQNPLSVGGIVVNAIAPHLLSVAKVSRATFFGPNAIVDLVVTFNEPVKITGVPSLILSVGGSPVSADYQDKGESYSLTHTFRYIVGNGHNGSIQVTGLSPLVKLFEHLP